MKTIEQIKEKALEDHIPIIMDDTLEVVGKILEDKKPDRILEIGTEVLPTLTGPYDVVFIDAAKGKYPIFLSEALRMLASHGIIVADNVLYKGYVMSDYNKHKQRTAVRGLREFLKELTENENLTTEILEVGDGLAISKKM